MSKIILAAAAAVALFGGAAMADQVQTTVLNAGHVNFTDRAQTQAFYAKINAAAREVCSIHSSNPMLARPERDCMAKAVADAVRHVNAPLLTAAYDSDTSNRALATNDQ